VPKIGRIHWISFAVAVITLALFWPVTTCEFVNFDDPEYVFQNAHVAQGFNLQNLLWAFTTRYASNWHPLTWISHMLDCHLSGLESGDHHLTNLMLHAANAVLLFLLLHKLTRAVWRSAFVAALFAWHPLHVESVAWVSERKDVLSTFFFLLTVWAYSRYVESETQNAKCKTQNYFLSLFFFACGLMSKPMVVTTPFLLLLLDFWPLNRLQLNRKNLKLRSLLPFVIEKLPFFALAALDCAVTVWAQRSEAISSLEVLPLRSRIANALISYVLYLWKAVWTRHLAVLYPYSHEWTFLEAAGAGLFLAAVSVWAIRQARQRPYLALGWFWYLGSLIPVIGLVQVGMQSMADRYTYLPLIGIFIMVAWGAASVAHASGLSPGVQRQVSRSLSCGFVAAGVVLLVLVICARIQLQYWQSSVTLWSRALQVIPNNLRAEYNLGVALGDSQDAIPHYLRAIQIQPTRIEEPAGIHALAHENLGVLLSRQAKWPEAEAHFRAALEEKPDHWETRANLGGCLEAEGRFEEAIGEFRTALQGAADSSDTWRHLGDTLVRASQSQEAEKAYRQALKLNPNGSVELNDMAWFLATDPHAELRNGTEALTLAQRACELTAGSDTRCLGTLDAAYAEAGRFEEAIAAAQHAQEVARAQGQNYLANFAAERIELYRAGKCYRQH